MSETPFIFDAHCHAWTRWPYQPAVPDRNARGRVEQLLHEMEQCGVARALVVCASLGGNQHNNSYVANQAQRYPSRLAQLADLDSEWSTSYHRPGAAARLRSLAGRYPLAGFTHYLKETDDGAWLNSEEGCAVFETAQALGLVASLSSYPYQQPAIRRVAQRFPGVPLLIHHLGYPAQGRGTLEDNLSEILASAAIPNIYIKISGFAYAAEPPWEYPYTSVQPIVRAIYEHFGPQRMCWGSDYPVVRFYMTYRQALEAFRTHCGFIPAEDQAWVLGKTLAGLLLRAPE